MAPNHPQSGPAGSDNARKATLRKTAYSRITIAPIHTDAVRVGSWVKFSCMPTALYTLKMAHAASGSRSANILSVRSRYR